MKSLASPALLLCALACAPSAPALARAAPANDIDTQVTASESFLAAHPDLRFRQWGMKAYLKGDARKAMEHFKRAARYADKPSQGMVGELLWNGNGVAADRALAHAWLELAAEREFAVLIRQRDRYWAALTPEERERSQRALPGLRAEYADAVAQPRLERVLRRARGEVTGSRTGMSGNLRIILPGPGGDITIDGSQFYQDKFWNAEDYWAWQAETWKDPPKPRVDVGPLEADDKP